MSSESNQIIRRNDNEITGGRDWMKTFPVSTGHALCTKNGINKQQC